MNFTDISVGIYPDKGWRIQWGIDGITSSDEVVIQRASSPKGPFSEIGVAAYDEVLFKDVVSYTSGFFTDLYYRLVVRDSGTGEVKIVSNPIATQVAGTKITNEMIRQHELLLKGVNAAPGFFSHRFACFKKTKSSTPCPYCVDPLTGERGLVVKCDSCGGTGVIEGYSRPIEFYGSWKEPINRSRFIDFSGERENLQRTMFLAAHPIIETGDVILEKNGYMYEVTNVRANVPGGILTSQFVTCSAMDPKNFIYDKLKFPYEWTDHTNNLDFWRTDELSISPVTIWRGLNGSVLYQTDDALKPTLAVDCEQNPCVVFDNSKLSFNISPEDWQDLDFCVSFAYSELNLLATNFLWGLGNSADTNNYIGLQTFPSVPLDDTSNVIRVIGRDNSGTLFSSTEVSTPNDASGVITLNFKGSEFDLWIGETKVISGESTTFIDSLIFDTMSFGCLTRTTDAFFLDGNLKKVAIFSKQLDDDDLRVEIIRDMLI